MFLSAETFAYLVLDVLLAITTLLAIGSAGMSLWTAATELGAADSVVATIDRLLFVFMLVEILHTVRVSFRMGILVCEPFLIVGLIASIRRVLVITLKSSAASQGREDHNRKPGAISFDNVGAGGARWTHPCNGHLGFLAAPQ